MKKLAFLALIVFLYIVVPMLVVDCFKFNWIWSFVCLILIHLYLVIRYFQDIVPLGMMDDVQTACGEDWGFAVGLAIFILFGSIYWYISATAPAVTTARKLLWRKMLTSTA